MDWFLYALAAYFVVNALWSVALTDKPRKPIAAPQATVMVLWYGTLAFGCYSATR